MTKAKHNYYLFSENLDKKIFTLNKGEDFDREKIKDAMWKHFEAQHNDTLEWTKEDTDTHTVGDDIIDFYEYSLRGNFIYKLITRGSRTFRKKID